MTPQPIRRNPRMRSALPWAALLLVSLGWAALLAGCDTAPIKVQVPGRVQYFEASMLADQDLYTEAITKLQSVATENSGTRIGTFSYLKLGELYSKQENWVEADANYRIFLSLNSNSQLTPYVLYRLMEVNYQKGLTGLFFPAREIDRDMEPNRRIMVEFKRFFLLYPNSTYMAEVRPYYRAARELLARYELMVGDFYLKREHYYSAIGRYLYLLRNYPEYPDSDDVLTKLIEAYRENQQPDLADEMERIYQQRYVSREREDLELEATRGGSRPLQTDEGPEPGELPAPND